MAVIGQRTRLPPVEMEKQSNKRGTSTDFTQPTKEKKRNRNGSRLNSQQDDSAKSDTEDLPISNRPNVLDFNSEPEEGEDDVPRSNVLRSSSKQQPKTKESLAQRMGLVGNKKEARRRRKFSCVLISILYDPLLFANPKVQEG